MSAKYHGSAERPLSWSSTVETSRAGSHRMVLMISKSLFSVLLNSSWRVLEKLAITRSMLALSTGRAATASNSMSLIVSVWRVFWRVDSRGFKWCRRIMSQWGVVSGPEPVFWCLQMAQNGHINGCGRYNAYDGVRGGGRRYTSTVHMETHIKMHKMRFFKNLKFQSKNMVPNKYCTYCTYIIIRYNQY